jgi:hypothetical protein
MSATKHMRKQVKLATLGELCNWENQALLAIEQERNVLKRSSLRQQLTIIRDEQRVRINREVKA